VIDAAFWFADHNFTERLQMGASSAEDDLVLLLNNLGLGAF
jgi:hypothetical protein